MAIPHTYEPLPGQGTDHDNSDMPSIPPSYREVEDGRDNNGNNADESVDYLGNADIEQFEIDDFDIDPSPREGILSRASSFTKKVAFRFNKSVRSVTNMIDPIYEGLSYLNQSYEKTILKLGNPLVVKRLLYVLVMVGVVFLVSHYTVNEGINGASGGAFSNGRFYNIDKLASMIPDHIDAKVMQNHLEYFSSMPHISGTVGDLTISEYIETYMKNNGVQTVERVELHSFVNYPKSKSYIELSDGSFKAKLYETDNNEMEFLAHNPNALKLGHEVEAPLVFANFGTKQDFQTLKENNVDIQDCIVLIRYGGGVLESNKLYMASASGAKAVIFISRKVPIGTTENVEEFDDVIQRENVGFSRFSTGDILTPGWASENGYVSKLLWFKSKVTPKIPTIPISFKDGEELLKVLNNHGYKFDENSYSGPSDDESKKLKLKVETSERDTHAIWNIVGTIEGREQDDKCVIIGSTRDAACTGTISSNTGTVVMLEMIKLFTSMQRMYNWTPARTIKFVSFDATNYNLAGSTEWIEVKKKELQSQAYAYIDLSDAISGDNLSIKANPFLHKIIRECLKQVKSDRAPGKREDQDSPASEEPPRKESLNLYELYKKQNQGSDAISNQLIENKNYIPFINLLNVPSMEIKFQGSSYAENSCYDNFHNFQKSGIDPSMQKHGELVELLTRILLNVAEQAFIPFNFSEFVQRLIDYQVNLSKYIDDVIKKGSKPSIPQIHYEKLMKAIALLKESAKDYDDFVDSWKKFIVESADIEQAVLAMKRWQWNEALVIFNSQFIIDESMGKTIRPGYLNMLFGTSFDAPVSPDNWEWNTFPLIKDCVDQGEYGKTQLMIDSLANVIADAAAHRYMGYR